MNTALVLKNNSQPLTDDVLSAAQSLYSDRAMDGLSSKYRLVPTSKVIDGMRDVGWAPVHVTQNRVVSPAKMGYQKHMIRFRSLETKVILNEAHMELVLINSHDGSSAYQLSAGLFRQVCLNGLVVGEETCQTIRFRHSGTEASEILRASLDVIQWMPELSKSIETMKGRNLDASESLRFCQHALKLRYPENPPINADRLLQERRGGDIGNDLWVTFNRCQEHLLYGGINDGTKGKNGRTRSMRGIKSIDSNIQLNKGLWSLAARIARGDELPDINSLTE